MYIEYRIHVLSEKPLAMKVHEVAELKDIARKRTVMLGVVYNYRYFPAVIYSLKENKKGYLGNVISLHGLSYAHFPIGWTRSAWLYHRGGVLYDFAPHLIDLLLLFGSGKPKKATALGGDYLKSSRLINHASLLIELDNRTNITAHISWLMGTFMFYIWLYETRGHIFLDVRYDTYEEVHRKPNPLDSPYAFIRNVIKIGKNVLNKKFFVGALGNLPLHYKGFHFKRYK